MVIGVLSVELIIPASASLKDKRIVIKSIKDRLRARYNVSVAETEYHEKWQRAGLAIVTVSSETARVDQLLQKIFSVLDKELDFEIIKYNFEYR